MAGDRLRAGHRRWRWGRWALLLLASTTLLLLVTPEARGGGGGNHRTIRIEGSQYRFEPGVIDVKRGDRVTIELVAMDVVHGLYVDGYGLEVTAEPGQTARLTFVADRPGTFRFRCSVSCGAMHPFMIGKLRVGTNPLLWTGLGLAVLAMLGGLIRFREEPS